MHQNLLPVSVNLPLLSPSISHYCLRQSPTIVSLHLRHCRQRLASVSLCIAAHLASGHCLQQQQQWNREEDGCRGRGAGYSRQLSSECHFAASPPCWVQTTPRALHRVRVQRSATTRARPCPCPCACVRAYVRACVRACVRREREEGGRGR